MGSETLTVLFTDVVGSTALSTSMDVESADALRREHFSLLRDALVQHGGREVKNLGDGLMAVFSSPSSALASATAMQQSVDRRNRSSPAVVGLRVGISAGECTAEDGDYFGDAVVEASRLCALATGGQVLVAALVRTMAGRRSRLSFADLGPLELKGLPDPVPTLGLEWARLADGRAGIPLPEPLAHPGPGFFGRAAERQQLATLLDESATGGRRVVLLGGEPGIGKTALTAVTARRAHELGTAVLYGRCVADTGAPYQPFVQALDHYVRFAPRHELDAHVAEHGGELARLVPSLARRVPDAPAPSASDPDTERYLAFGAAAGLLAGAAAERPVLVVLDDLHWADPGTLSLLRHLASAAPSGRLLTLGTFRSNEVTSTHPLAATLAALWREIGVTRVELSGLSPSDVEALCASAAGHAVDDGRAAGFVAALQRDTGGNPFFVWELLRHLVETGGLVHDASGRWTADPAVLTEGLPASLREVVSERIRHLGAGAERVLTLAAVIGAEFGLPTLAAVAGSPEEDVLDLVELAEGSALLHETGDGGTFAFGHALIRHTLYDSLRPARRRQLHGRVAGALLERGDGTAALLAYHYAAAGESEPALHHAERAGGEALAATAPDEAVRWFAQALSLLEAVEPGAALHRCDLTTQLGVAERLAGDPGYRDTLLDAVATAERAGDARRMAVAALANSRGYYSAAGQTDEQRMAALRAALDRLDDEDDGLRARLLATLCSETVFDAGSSPAERRQLVDRAKAEARALGDPVTLLDVLNLVTEVLRTPASLPERLADTAEALALADALDDPAPLFWAVGNRMRSAIEAACVPEARALFQRLGDVAGELGQPVMRWMMAYSRAQWAFMDGESDVGERWAEEALAVGAAAGQPDAPNFYAAQLSHARWQQGRLGEIVERIEAGARDNPGIPAYRASLVRALCQAGRRHEACDLLDQGAARRFADLRVDLLWTTGMAMYAEAAIQLDHVAAAAELYGQLSPVHGCLVFVGTSCEGPVDHYLGGLATVLGRLDEAAAHLETAATLGERAASPFFVARTAIERGRLAARRLEPDAARRCLAEGLTTAERWSFAAEADRARAALDRLRR